MGTEVQPSVGWLGFIRIDQGRTAELSPYSLSAGNVNTSNFLRDDRVGPLNSVDNFFLILGFLEDTEKPLYPRDVKLLITREKYY